MEHEPAGIREMVRRGKPAILVAIALAAIVIVSFPFAPERMSIKALVTDRLAITCLSIWSLAAIPVAFVMPRLRALFFGRIWHVPSTTYVLPRWMVPLGIGVMMGQVAGILALAVLRDYRLFWLAGSLTLVVGAFCAGAWPRWKKPPQTEFAVPWWWCWKA